MAHNVMRFATCRLQRIRERQRPRVWTGMSAKRQAARSAAQRKLPVMRSWAVLSKCLVLKPRNRKALIA
jgi:hypothetical protein